MKIFSSAASVLAVFFSLQASAVNLPPIDDAKPIWDLLSKGQQARVDAGEIVATPERVGDSEWPLSVAFLRANATAEEVAAVFSDYDLQKTYVPMVLESKVVGTNGPTRAIVDYLLDVGILWMKSSYTVENSLSHLSDADRYRINWTMVKASDASAIDGVVRVEPRGTGALFFYRLYTEINAGPFKEKAKKDGFDRVKASVRAIVAQVEKERRENPALLRQQIDRLRKSLGR